MRCLLVGLREEEPYLERTCLAEGLGKLAWLSSCSWFSYPFLAEDPSQGVCRSDLKRNQILEVCHRAKLNILSVEFNTKGLEAGSKEMFAYLRNCMP